MEVFTVGTALHLERGARLLVKKNNEYVHPRNMGVGPDLPFSPVYSLTCRVSLLISLSASSNSVGVAYTDDGQPYGGRGGAVYNSGADGSVVFMGLAIFKDNIGEMVRTREYERGCLTKRASLV